MKNKILYIFFLGILFFQVPHVHAQANYESVIEKIHYTYPNRKTKNSKGEWIPQSVPIVIGATNPRIKIYMYGDLLDIYTQQFFRQTFDTLLRNHQNDVQLIYQHHPFDPSGEKSIQAEMIGECVAEQGQFWSNALSIGNYRGDLDNLSYLVNIDSNTLRTCLADPRTRASVTTEGREADLFGFNGVPTFIIQNTANPEGYVLKLSGAQDITIFERAIREVLGFNPDKEQITNIPDQIDTSSELGPALIPILESEQKISTLQNQINTSQHFIDYLLQLLHIRGKKPQFSFD